MARACSWRALHIHKTGVIHTQMIDHIISYGPTNYFCSSVTKMVHLAFQNTTEQHIYDKNEATLCPFTWNIRLALQNMYIVSMEGYVTPDITHWHVLLLWIPLNSKPCEEIHGMSCITSCPHWALSKLRVLTKVTASTTYYTDGKILGPSISGSDCRRPHESKEYESLK